MLRVPAEPRRESPYVYPSLDLLAGPQEHTGFSPEEDTAMSRRLGEILASFRVPVQVVNVVHGPSVSRFELRLGEGIRVGQVTRLAEDIAVRMGVQSVRIGVVPGRFVLGVEIPNRIRGTVTLREVLESPAMKESSRPLTVALGRDVEGQPVVCPLTKMPHLLIAGSPGGGKSTCVSAIIGSILYSTAPHDVRLVLLDGADQRLQAFSGVPHLLTPVVGGPQKASRVLAWLSESIKQRYRLFEKVNVFSIDSYNSAVLGQRSVKVDFDKLEDANLGDAVISSDHTLPRIVVIISELADLVISRRKEAEEYIGRLLLLGRPAGIHLVIATRCPTDSVITPVIGSNISSRIAFRTAVAEESRVILNSTDARQLLGRGDMLYFPCGVYDFTRMQGCCLSDREISAIAEDVIKKNSPVRYNSSVEDFAQCMTDADGDDSGRNSGSAADGALLKQAIEIAIRAGGVSPSLLQRRLQLGYTQADRIVKRMEKLGVIRAKEGTGPWATLITREEYEQMRADGKLDEV